MHRNRHLVGGLFALLTLCSATSPAIAQVPPLQPFKDELFRYPEPVASLDGGAVLDVPYSEARDIDRRDEVPERRVSRAYVDLAPNRSRRDDVLETPRGELRWSSVGDATNPSLVVVFVHGRNGDRTLGMNDWTFGGNFNRLKNLVTRAGGLYATVDGGRLDGDDAARLGGLIESLRANQSGARLVLACGSMGGGLCWTAVEVPAVARALDGLVLLSASSDAARFARLSALRGSRPLPILVAHGTRDKVYGFDRQIETFRRVRRERPGDPLRFVGFDGGNHGTPIRMIDWRDTLNWILTR